MGAATIVTLIGVAVAVIAIAAYLTIVAYKLYKVSFTVGTILIGVRSIAHQTEPVGEVVGGIGADVSAIERTLGGLLEPQALPSGDAPSGRKAVRGKR